MKIKSKIIQLVIVLCVSFFIICPVEARNLKATLSRIPLLSESSEKGLLVDLLKAMDEIYTEGNISIEVYPSARAIDNLVKRDYDLLMPMLRSQHVNEAELPFAYSEMPVFTAMFVLYTNKNNKEITPENAGNFVIETEAPLVNYYGFKARVSSGPELSLSKVDMGRIDGYIMAMTETDGVLKPLNLKNIKRTYFGTFDAPIVLKKGPEGKEVEKILTDLLNRLKENGTYAKIMAPMLNQEFKEW